MQILIKRSLRLLPAGSVLFQTRDWWYAGKGKLLSPTTLRTLESQWYAAFHEGEIPKDRWYVGPSGQVTQDFTDLKWCHEQNFECFLFKMDALVESEKRKNPATRYDGRGRKRR